MRDLAGVDLELVLDAFVQAGRGLAAAHEHGIYHQDLKPENICVHIKEDPPGSIAKLWAKVADFSCALHGPADHATRVVAAADDQRAFASALRECAAAAERPSGAGELMPGWLQAVLDRASMSEPDQQWVDVSSFVDAIERGRKATAATDVVRGRYEHAIAHAQDEAFSEALLCWREFMDALAGNHVEIGRHGFALGAAMFNAAREATGSAKRRGFRRCLDVLQDALRSFEAAGDLDGVRDVSSLAAQACDAWQATYPPTSPDHHQLAELARSYRER
jgi:hypothetical protein